MRNKFLFIILLLSMTNVVTALEADKSSPIHIEADRVDLDDKNGVSTYTGNVTLKQGSIQIQADAIIVYSLNKQIDRIIANGNPARFEQKPDQKTEPVTAHATRVEYNTSSGILILEDHAKLQQGKNEFSGNKIEYDTLNDIMRASKNTDNGERVKAVIQPNVLEQ